MQYQTENTLFLPPNNVDNTIILSKWFSIFYFSSTSHYQKKMKAQIDLYVYFSVHTEFEKYRHRKKLGTLKIV